MKKVPKMTSKERKAIVRAMGLMFQLGLTMVVCVAMGLFSGRFLDEWLGTSPWLLIIFSLMGCGAAFKVMIDLSKKF